MAVALQQNKATVRRWYAELDKANLEALDNILSPHIVVHFPGEAGPINRDEYMRINRKFFAGFSDFQTTVLDQIGEGDKVVTRAMHSVVHSGEYEGSARPESDWPTPTSRSTDSRTEGSWSIGWSTTKPGSSANSNLDER